MNKMTTDMDAVARRLHAPWATQAATHFPSGNQPAPQVAQVCQHPQQREVPIMNHLGCPHRASPQWQAGQVWQPHRRENRPPLAMATRYRRYVRTPCRGGCRTRGTPWHPTTQVFPSQSTRGTHPQRVR